MRWLFAALLFILLSGPVQAQEPVYIPLVFGGEMATDPILIVTDGSTVVNLLGPGSGWKLADPYWNLNVAAFKGGGSFLSSSLAEGRRLTSGEYDNVIETIPLAAFGTTQDAAIKTLRELMQLGRQASDYWTKPYEYNDVWLEARPACNSCFSGYSRIVSLRIPELTNPYGQPFFSASPEAVMEGITVLIEREPFWRGVKPGEIIGPLYNLIDNPDFELWNFGTVDSQPDSWTDLETLWITGSNNRQDSAVKWGQYALKIRVGSSTQAGAAKGVTQVIADTRNSTEYTVLAWVRSEGVSNGVGRILINYSSQLELYRSSTAHGWTLYTGKITTGNNDVVSINCEILTTGANTDGTIYIDGLMFTPGDWEQEAIDGLLPQMSASHIVNHYDQATGIIEAGGINYVDVWNIPGDVDALTRVEFINNTEPADITDPDEIYETVRIGQRRTNNIFNLRNFYDPPGIADATASGDARINSPALTNNWLTLAIQTITGGQNVRDNEGRYRVFARVWDTAATATLQARLRYFVGASLINLKTLDAATAQIRNNWTLLDLTNNAAMIQEQHFASQPPGQIGYQIELKRATGSNAAYLDYVLSIPTDGGYIDATITPPLHYQSGLIVDNTNSVTIGNFAKQQGWQLDWQPPTGTTNYIQQMAVFKGALYVGMLVDLGGFNFRGQIWQNKQGIWTMVYQDDEPSQFFGSAVYNDKLYFSIFPSGGATPWLLATSEGTIWSKAYNSVTPGAVRMDELVSLGGYLYVVTTSSTIERYNGSSGIVDKVLPASADNMIVGGDNKLYLIISNSLYKYDPTTKALVNVGALSPSGQMAFYKGYVYCGTTGTSVNIVQRYGGGTIETITIPNPGIGNFTVTGMQVYNDKLFVIISAAVGTDARDITYETQDGITWTPSPAGELLYFRAVANYYQMVVYDGVLYAGTIISAVPIVGYLYSFVDTSITYESIVFNGGTFFSPNRDINNPRYHRWVFSYDRDGYINNIDDKALVGFGYVPRYLGLRGHD